MARAKRSFLPGAKWLWVKNRYLKWNPGKWRHGPKPAVPWWFNFDPYPNGCASKHQSTRRQPAGLRLCFHQERPIALVRPVLQSEAYPTNQSDSSDSSGANVRRKEFELLRHLASSAFPWAASDVPERPTGDADPPPCHVMIFLLEFSPPPPPFFWLLVFVAVHPCPIPSKHTAPPPVRLGRAIRAVPVFYWSRSHGRAF